MRLLKTDNSEQSDTHELILPTQFVEIERVISNKNRELANLNDGLASYSELSKDLHLTIENKNKDICILENEKFELIEKLKALSVSSAEQAGVITGLRAKETEFLRLNLDLIAANQAIQNKVEANRYAASLLEAVI